MQERAIYNAVKAETNDETAQMIINGDNENDLSWVNNTMKRLEDNFDKSTIKKIRMNCQCGYGMDEKFALLNELVRSSANLEEFTLNEKAKAAGLSLIDNQLHLQFPFCPCPMLAKVEKLNTNTWCQCTTGYSKVVFEKAFGCEVNVELLKSIKMGDDICLMKIIPLGTIQFS